MGCPLSASADPGSLPAVSVCVSWLPAASVLSTSVVVVALSGLATTGTDGPLGAVTVAGPAPAAADAAGTASTCARV